MVPLDCIGCVYVCRCVCVAIEVYVGMETMFEGLDYWPLICVNQPTNVVYVLCMRCVCVVYTQNWI